MKKEITNPIIYLSLSLSSWILFIVLDIFEFFVSFDGDFVTNLLDIWSLSMIVIGILLLSKYFIKKYPHKILIIIGLIINFLFFVSIIRLA